MSDIVEKLRETYESVVTGNDVLRNPDGPEAAARIQQLEAALREIADHTTNPEGSGPAYGMVGKLVRTARAALEERT